MIGRINFICPRDCSACEALQDGRIEDPVLCMTDQMFKSQLRVEDTINSMLKTSISDIEVKLSLLTEAKANTKFGSLALADVDKENEEEINDSINKK